MKNAREKILQTLRQSSSPASAVAPLPRPLDALIYKNYPPARQNPLQTFAQKLAALKGEFYPVGDERQAATVLRELLSNIPITKEAKSIARHHHALLDRVCAGDAWFAENVQIIDGQKISSPAFAEFTAGITAVDFLVARTGSIVLSTATAGGRRLSVLPPLHIAVATTAQLVFSLGEALQAFHERNASERSSYATIITGPSRTSDIEKILVLGAHGPKRLAVIVMG